jgi:hypothetical protein
MLLKHESGRFGPWLATGRVQCNRARGIGGACSAWATLTNLFLTGASKCAELAKGGSRGASAVPNAHQWCHNYANLFSACTGMLRLLDCQVWSYSRAAGEI